MEKDCFYPGNLVESDDGIVELVVEAEGTIMFVGVCVRFDKEAYLKKYPDRDMKVILDQYYVGKLSSTCYQSRFDQFHGTINLKGG